MSTLIFHFTEVIDTANNQHIPFTAVLAQLLWMTLEE